MPSSKLNVVFTPDEYAHSSSLFTHENPSKCLKGPNPQAKLTTKHTGLGLWEHGKKKIITDTWTASLNLSIVLHLSIFLLPTMSPVQSTGNTASRLPATEAPADCLEYLAKEGACEILRAGQEGWGAKEVCLGPTSWTQPKGTMFIMKLT